VLVLALDTSTPAVTVTIGQVGVNGVRRLAHRVTIDGRRHAEVLVPSIRQCLDEIGRTVGDLDAVVAGLGPGPFTGLRVGLMTAGALADAAGLPTYGVCSLDGLAVPVDHGPRPLLVATDARRREVYWALYDHGGHRVIGPTVNRPAEVVDAIDALAAHQRPVRAVGEGAHRYAAVLGVPASGEVTPAPVVIPAALDRIVNGAPGERLVPLYLRRPDAVEPGARKAVRS
jgi:tRNA threonylcarbamoyl adenosine modification protein YeaZ